MKELLSFYSNLYCEKVSARPVDTQNEFLNDKNIPKLNKDERESCEGEFTINECLQALKSFDRNKSPGNDGLTAEFYFCFCPLLGKQLVECLNYSHKHG